MNNPSFCKILALLDTSAAKASFFEEIVKNPDVTMKAISEIVKSSFKSVAKAVSVLRKKGSLSVSQNYRIVVDRGSGLFGGQAKRNSNSFQGIFPHTTPFFSESFTRSISKQLKDHGNFANAVGKFDRSHRIFSSSRGFWAKNLWHPGNRLSRKRKAY